MENRYSTGSFALQMQNPFSFKVGQVFTGFGVGCGIGIGIGRPLNLGAIPALQQVMTATRGATDAFSGVGRRFNSSLRRLGAKQIEAGIGCGVGFGHGFGVGIAVKPGAIQSIQSLFMQAGMKMLTTLGISPGLPAGSNSIANSLQNISSDPQALLEKMRPSVSKSRESAPICLGGDENMNIHTDLSTFASKERTSGTIFGSRSEKVISDFLQNPALKSEEEMKFEKMAGQLQSEKNVLHMLLTHQMIIEGLIKENEKLRQILVEDFKVPYDRLHSSKNTRARFSFSVCDDCFECRRRQRQRK